MKAFLCPSLSWGRGHMWAPGCGSVTPDTCSVPGVHLGPTEKGLDREWSLSLLLQPWGCSALLGRPLSSAALVCSSPPPPSSSCPKLASP